MSSTAAMTAKMKPRTLSSNTFVESFSRPPRKPPMKAPTTPSSMVARMLSR
jgi:hypothetical protein